MQKLHMVTIKSGSVIFETAVMGNKLNARGNKIPLSKTDAIEIAYLRFFSEKFNINLSEVSGSSWDFHGRPVFVADIPVTKLAAMSDTFKSRIMGEAVSASVETISLKGMSADCIGKKRDANGKKIRARNNKNHTIDGQKPDTSVKTTTLPTAANAVKAARARLTVKA